MGDTHLNARRTVHTCNVYPPQKKMDGLGACPDLGLFSNLASRPDLCFHIGWLLISKSNTIMPKTSEDMDTRLKIKQKIEIVGEVS